MMSAGASYAGLDGCPGGWVCVRWDGGAGISVRRVVLLADIFDDGAPPDVAAIDIPIGLPDRAGAGGRAAEREVRPKLGMRQSSVFSVPSRAAVEAGGVGSEADRYARICAVARATSDPPRAISKQCYHILPKILEVDALLRARPDIRALLFECHPEVSFWAMNGQMDVPLPKKVQGRPSEAGIDLRRQLMGAAGLPVADMTRERARLLKVGYDDLIDACAAAWTARRIALGRAFRFPDPPEIDGAGLVAAIHA